MKKSYKNYEIEVHAEKDADKWSVVVTFKPLVSAVREVHIFGKYSTETESETAGFEWAQKRIDEHAP